MSNHFYNIERCLTCYRDLKAAEQWLRRGREELSSTGFNGLLDEVMCLIVDNPLFSDIAEDVVRFLSEYDSRYTAQWRELCEGRRSEAERVARDVRLAEERWTRETQAREREQREADERQIRERALEEKKRALTNRCRDWFSSGFLSADSCFSVDAERDLLPTAQYLEMKVAYVQEWTRSKLGVSLDAEQAQSVAAGRGDTLVVARAGAGKTRTLVTRAVFLQQHCGIKPDELLLLAFNREAAVEMRDRLRKALDGDVPHVMTFHALAHALVHPDAELIYDDPSRGKLGLSREIQRVIDEHLKSDRHRGLVRDVMLLHFREDWERIVAGGFNLPCEELVAYRLALPRETLKGEYVKSYGEKLIANTLFQHNVKYKYESPYRWDDVMYRPDFTIKLPNDCFVVIEYFGWKGDRDYDDMSARKREYWTTKKEATLIEFSPQDIASRGADCFVKELLKRLTHAGVETRALSDDEIWQQIDKRAIGSFTQAVGTFVGQCRKLNLSSEGLADLIDGHDSISEAERLFLDVGASVYAAFLNRLGSSHQQVFDGLMWQAIELINSGNGRFARNRGRDCGDLVRIRHVLVDEFQDFSDMFYQMVMGIRSLSPHADFFCVGDNWQAIYGFAGSDLKYFDDFGTWFRDSKTFNVSTNYRSPSSVVSLGNALMIGLGSPAKSNRHDVGQVILADLSTFTPSDAEDARHREDRSTPALLRLVRRSLDGGNSIVLLSRTNAAPWKVNYQHDGSQPVDGLDRFVDHLRKFLPEVERSRLTSSNCHEYKGRQCHTIIILDADESRYPLIHPNWIFQRVFGATLKSIESEERRLFYVALTRSQNSLIVLCKSERRASPYLREIKERVGIESVKWEEFRPAPSLGDAQIQVRVSDAYAVRKELYSQGFQFNSLQKYWHRFEMAEGVDARTLRAQSWAQPSVRIELYTVDGHLIQEI